jgi:hypothetical protein
MMTPAGWVKSGAVSGVECTVRQFGPAFRWNPRHDLICHDRKGIREQISVHTSMGMFTR